MGHDAEAANTLTLAGQSKSRTVGLVAEQHLAFLARIQYRLGRLEEARTALGRLRAIVNLPWVPLERQEARFSEIDALEQSLELPADPFAP